MAVNRLLLVVTLVFTMLSGKVVYTGEGFSVTEGQDGCGDINGLVFRLQSNSLTTRSRAKRRLFVAASRSVACRQTVVQALIRVLKKRGDEESTVPTRALYDAADLLGELKATEAIDTLVRYLDLNDGTVGFSLAHVPAVRAVVQIGDEAVPALILALFEGETSIRENAALALGLIGGSAAREALERALITETETHVKFHIEQGLKENR